jgi:hypothetical protein
MAERKLIVSRIARMEYKPLRKRLHISLRDYDATLWLTCDDDDDAANFAVRLSMSRAYTFWYNPLTNELVERPR